MAATTGKPKKDADSEEQAALTGRDKKLKAEAARLESRNRELTGEIGKSIGFVPSGGTERDLALGPAGTWERCEFGGETKRLPSRRWLVG